MQRATVPALGVNSPAGKPPRAGSKRGTSPYALGGTAGSPSAASRANSPAPGERRGEDTRRIHAAFCRLARNGRLHAQDLNHALELSGIRPVQDWVDRVLPRITAMPSLTGEEYVRLVRAYEAHVRQVYREAFQRADGDSSGMVEVVELREVLRELGIAASRRVLESILSEVDTDGSETLNFPEFERMMELLRLLEGFTRQEHGELLQLFRRYDREGSGHIGTDGVHGALQWLGYAMSHEEVDEVVTEVDVDLTRSLDSREFLICMRKAREHEVRALGSMLEEHDADGSGELSIGELRHLIEALGYTPDGEAVDEIAREIKQGESDPAEWKFDAEDLMEFLRLYRTREGFTLARVKEVASAFERYDTGGVGEISTLDVGKVLRWFGYTVPFEVQQYIIKQVDIDGSGKLNLPEVRKLLRMCAEEEVADTKKVFRMEDTRDTGTITKHQAHNAMRKLRFLGSGTKDPRVLEEAGRSISDFLRTCIRLSRQAREAYRQNGGYTDEELAKLQKLFSRYDADNSGTVSFGELGAFIRGMFQDMSENLRPRLDKLMREVQQGGSRSLDFQDFIRLFRQFHNLQIQEKLEKEGLAIKETDFSDQEVQDFRELFLQNIRSSTGLEHSQELSLSDLKRLVGNICPLGDKNMAVFMAAFQEVRRPQHKPRETVAPQREAVDFPDFLRVMRNLMDTNLFKSFRDQDAGGGSSRGSLS